MKPKKMRRRGPAAKKGRMVGLFGGVSGGMGIVSAHNACHAICTAVVSAAAVFGISGLGMPLAFLQDYNVYFWAMAVAFLLAGLALLAGRKCISKNTMMFNGGVVLAGTPFPFLGPVLPAFWVGGSGLALLGILNFVRERMKPGR